MRYIKKKAALILAVIMTFSVLLPISAEENKEPIRTEEFLLLQGLGMVDEEIAARSGGDVMTRAQFAGIQARLAGCVEGSVSAGNRFIDVMKGSLYDDEIHYLRNLGIVSGADPYRFLPDDPITLEQACAIAVTALGYKRAAEEEHGGYSDGYIYMAHRSGLLDGGIEKDHPLTVEEGMRLLKKTALALVYVAKQIGSNEIRYETEEGRTLIAEYCGIWADKGIFTDNGITALNGASKAGEGRLVIGGRTLTYDAKADTAGKIGRYVEYYYKDTGNESRLIYLCERAKDNKVLRIRAEDLCVDDSGYGVDTILYYKDDKIASAKLSVDLNLIYNGAAYPEFDRNTLMLESGFLTLIDNSGDGIYDAAVVEEYQNCVVSSASAAEQKIYGANGICIDAVKYDYVFIYGDTGEPVSIDAVKKNSVLSYMPSYHNTVLTIYLSNKTVTGTVDRTGKDGENTFYEVNGVRYEAAHNLFADIENQIIGAALPEVGKAYLLRLDKDGRIAAAELMDENVWKYAYFVGMRSEGTFNQNTVFRLVMTDGSVFEGYTIDNVSLNGEKIKSAALMSNEVFYRDGKPKRQIIKVRINGDGDITAVETATEELNEFGYNAERFSRSPTLSTAKYFGNNVKIIGQYGIAPNAVVFEDLDKDDASANFSVEDIRVLTAADLIDGQRYSSVDFYEMDETLTASFVVYGSNPGGVYKDQLLTVRHVSETLDEEGNPIKAVSGIAYGAEVEYTESEDGVFPEDLKMGDVVRVELQGNKVRLLDKMISLADHPEPQIQVKIGNSMYESEWTNMFGYVYGKSNNAISLINSSGSAYGKISNVSLNANAGKVTIYDNQRKTVYAGTLGDITPAVTISSDGSYTLNEDTMLFVYRRYEYLREAVLVKY